MIPASQVNSVRNKDEIRRLLFDAVRSLPEAQTYFASLVESAELLEILFEMASIDSSDTIRLQACYYISQFPEHLLRNYEDNLLSLQGEEWESISEHAIVALAKIRSKGGLAFLIEKRLSPKLPWETKMLRLHLQDALKE
jgi:hypothetical protein